MRRENTALAFCARTPVKRVSSVTVMARFFGRSMWNSSLSPAGPASPRTPTAAAAGARACATKAALRAARASIFQRACTRSAPWGRGAVLPGSAAVALRCPGLGSSRRRPSLISRRLTELSSLREQQCPPGRRARLPLRAPRRYRAAAAQAHAHCRPEPCRTVRQRGRNPLRRAERTAAPGSPATMAPRDRPPRQRACRRSVGAMGHRTRSGGGVAGPLPPGRARARARGDWLLQRGLRPASVRAWRAKRVVSPRLAAAPSLTGGATAASQSDKRAVGRPQPPRGSAPQPVLPCAACAIGAAAARQRAPPVPRPLPATSPPARSCPQRLPQPRLWAPRPPCGARWPRTARPPARQASAPRPPSGADAAAATASPPARHQQHHRQSRRPASLTPPRPAGLAARWLCRSTPPQAWRPCPPLTSPQAAAAAAAAASSRAPAPPLRQCPARPPPPAPCS